MISEGSVIISRIAFISSQRAISQVFWSTRFGDVDSGILQSVLCDYEISSLFFEAVLQGITVVFFADC